MGMGNGYISKLKGQSRKNKNSNGPRPESEAESPGIQFLKNENPDLSERQLPEGNMTSSLPPSPREKQEDKIETGYPGPIGLDIGTANIVMAQNRNSDTRTLLQLNAFFPIPYSNITKQTLIGDNIPFLQKGNNLYILGYYAEDFANMLGGDTRKPVESGILNPKEEEGISVIKVVINKLVKRPKRKGEKICFSVPGVPVGSNTSIVYHESIIKMHLKDLGYSPIPINEGLAVVLSELQSTNYTGIGISMGGGMCNVCFSYLSVPIITYSIRKGGDYIDAMVGVSVGEPPTKIKVIKEKELDLSVEPGNRIETGLHIYYDDLFSTLCNSLQQIIGASDAIPRLSKALPLVLSGGTVLPKGSRGKFIKTLNNFRLPIKISDIIRVKKPLYATAKGALVMAMSEEAEI
jgi:hypothetical protein